ncbi:hypothetical protein [Oscillatoria acuminata]|uniref:Uncharacterized protein n=1 Tax=Oscillatoria acuminata PCC 6304 TaxID=56110 RepID=K9TH72_9CYAN|nr:hypothetical protein [Oscillatoria acuminata]AFY81491.1 hypothetical protein Oscil6304_1816 [Oscillatoria acuminata PCC 6304]
MEWITPLQGRLVGLDTSPLIYFIEEIIFRRFKTIITRSLKMQNNMNSEETRLKYNAWGKLTTKHSIQQAIEQMRKLQQEVALSATSIREMIDKGRRF